MTQQHTIDQLQVQVTGSNHKLVSGLQQQFGYLLNTGHFMRQLETVLDGIVPADTFLEIETLRVHLDAYGEKDLAKTLLRAIEKSIRSGMRTPSPNQLRLLSREEVEASQYLYFLCYGLQPLHTGPDIIIERIYQEIAALPATPSPRLEALLQSMLRYDTAVWKRLFFLLGKNGMEEYCRRAFSYPEAFFAAIFNTGNQPGATTEPAPTQRWNTVEPAFWQTLMPMLMEGHEAAKIKAFFFPVGGLPAPDLPVPPKEKIAARITEKKEWNALLDRGIVISNAGLVLVWLEFGRLMKQTGYTAGKNFTDETRCQQAIFLLQYICHGNTSASETELLLNKILVGWPPAEPVDPLCKPEAAVLEAADKMLEDFVTAWRKEKKYSINWFRASFLQREGRLLKRSDGNWQLNIQKRTEDILINKTSIVKYAWMNELVFVNW